MQQKKEKKTSLLNPRKASILKNKEDLLERKDSNLTTAAFSLEDSRRAGGALHLDAHSIKMLLGDLERRQDSGLKKVEGAELPPRWKEEKFDPRSKDAVSMAEILQQIEAGRCKTVSAKMRNGNPGRM